MPIVSVNKEKINFFSNSEWVCLQSELDRWSVLTLISVIYLEMPEEDK